MATLKHIASKNSDYTAIEAYLVYQHDEFSGKVILDERADLTAFRLNAEKVLGKLYGNAEAYRL